jgi:hypothetical protein
MENKKFKFFYLQQSSEKLLKIQCLFEEFDSEIIEEAKAVFQVVTLGTNFEVSLYLDKPKTIPPKFINLVLGFANDLFSEQRHFTIYYPPESFSFYIQKFKLHNLIRTAS